MHNCESDLALGCPIALQARLCIPLHLQLRSVLSHKRQGYLHEIFIIKHLCSYIFIRDMTVILSERSLL